MQTHVLRIRDLANTAGLITGTRLLIALAFPFLTAHPRVALAAYLFASLTDVLDGAVARRTHTASHTGAFVDGWVDKILHINGAWSMTLTATCRRGGCGSGSLGSSFSGRWS